MRAAADLRMQIRDARKARGTPDKDLVRLSWASCEWFCLWLTIASKAQLLALHLEPPMKPKNPTPPGWPRMSSSVYYDDASKAIDFLCAAFGFEIRLKIEGEGGRIEHCELEYGGGLVMVSQPKADKFPKHRSPREANVNTQNIMVYVDDVEAHFTQAKKAGAVIVKEPETHDYGDDHWTDRGYEAEDLEGHGWWFFQRLKTGGA
jgi:uncharacterized glyoxalase superfamily protein PhnB